MTKLTKSSITTLINVVTKVVLVFLCIFIPFSIIAFLFSLSNSNISISASEESLNDDDDGDGQDDIEDGDDDDDDHPDEGVDNLPDVDMFKVRGVHNQSSPMLHFQMYNQIKSGSTDNEIRWVYDDVDSILFTANKDHCLVNSFSTASSVAMLGSAVQLENCMNVRLYKSDSRKNDDPVRIRHKHNCIHDINNTWRWLPCTSSSPYFDIIK